ncbi:hypothetical protein NQ176_g2173 [Zarea fungicola]|uniref:Uncharacterized protein n=1 Tax=Zarea fungicola TaxID=93591 RepID=A0ACC1NQK5_9HYPO|nr:hypothetical protein NQ176_g2173 [Lecanicillium fungicola]
MRLSLPFLATLTVAYAQKPIYAVLWQKQNFDGEYKYIQTMNCVAITGALKNSVNAIQIDPGKTCALFRGPDCIGSAIEYTSETATTTDSKIKSLPILDILSQRIAEYLLPGMQVGQPGRFSG